MNVKRLIRDNWKGAVVGIAIGAAGAVGGPIAGKAVGILMPKALEHVSDTPITAIKAHESPFSKEKITHDPPTVTLRITPRERAMIADAARDHGATLRWRCVGVQP
jgi:hypothetical protein